MRRSTGGEDAKYNVRTSTPTGRRHRDNLGVKSETQKRLSPESSPSLIHTVMRIPQIQILLARGSPRRARCRRVIVLRKRQVWFAQKSTRRELTSPARCLWNVLRQSRQRLAERRRARRPTRGPSTPIVVYRHVGQHERLAERACMSRS